MTTTSELAELFVGPAVVVDDKIHEKGSGIEKIVDQLRAANIPLITAKTLPAPEQIKHWRGFSMIVLDWELFPDLGDPGELPSGISLPETLKDENSKAVSEFIQRLLDELYCPIFIFSNESVDAIWAALDQRLDGHSEQLRARILVRSKSELDDSLLTEVGGWLAEHPAIYALKSWEAGYEDAKKTLFADLQKSSLSWPRILWSTSIDDEVNPHFELTETISRNLLHRFAPLTFDKDILMLDSGDTTKEALRQVLHDQAVVRGDRLHPDVLMPGDFFFAGVAENEVPAQILINLTSACDLVPRGGQDPKDLRMVMIQADLVKDDQLASDKAFANTLKESEASHSQLLYLLTNSGHPYIVKFKNWSLSKWGDQQPLRQGRLLDPHVTQLQQKFGLYFQRQGLSRLPDDFYYRPATP